MNFINYYEVFGISENATQEEIKNAYKKLAKKYHPDANHGISEIERKEREEKLKDINEYKDILTNETLKQEYDQQLQECKREVERKQQEEQERRQYEEEIKKQQRQKYEEDKKEEKSILEKFKVAHREALKEERSYSFIKRHSDIDRKFFNDYYKKSNNIIINLGNQIGRITLHALGEFITQGERMTSFKGVSFPKYVMRNRYHLITGAIVLTMTFNSIGGVLNDKTEDEITSENKIEDIIDPENYQNTYTLNKYHTIEGGETLSQLAYDAGISSNSIRRPEVAGDGYFLQVGEEVIIPYQISQEDLEYYTYTVTFPKTTSLEEFAQNYNTDVETLQILNPEAIFIEAGNYYVISDTLLVPNFITQEELQAKKESTKQYQ